MGMGTFMNYQYGYGNRIKGQGAQERSTKKMTMIVVSPARWPLCRLPEGLMSSQVNSTGDEMK